LIERVVRNDEVVGLIPIWSTNSSSSGATPMIAVGTRRVAGMKSLASHHEFQHFQVRPSARPPRIPMKTVFLVAGVFLPLALSAAEPPAPSLFDFRLSPELTESLNTLARSLSTSRAPAIRPLTPSMPPPPVPAAKSMILVPASVDPRMPVKQPAPAIDPKMVVPLPARPTVK
jgi:hypothetical protein